MRIIEAGLSTKTPDSLSARPPAHLPVHGNRFYKSLAIELALGTLLGKNT